MTRVEKISRIVIVGLILIVGMYILYDCVMYPKNFML